MKKQLVLVLPVLLFALFAFAQDSGSQMFSLDNANILLQGDGEVIVSFDLLNLGGMQPGIKYGLEIVKKDASSFEVIDSFISQETFFLDANASVSKQISYNAPNYLRGAYSVLLFIRNENGSILAFQDLGEVNFSGSESFIEMVSGSCYLRVGEEQIKYNLEFGVDVSNDEELFAFCTIKNNFSEKKQFAPMVETFRRNSYGEKVDSRKLDEYSLNAGEQKEFSFQLPLISSPQAYDAKVTLISNGNTVSNSVIFHYVIDGVSATLHNVVLDKNNYSAGENVTVQFSWTGPAQNFADSRNQIEIPDLFAEISVRGSSGTMCFPKISQSLAKQISGSITLSEKVVSDCKDLEVSAVIKDSNGNVLDEMNFAANNSASFGAQGQNDQLIFVGIILVLLVLVVAGFLFVRMRVNK
jgi:hypothetical protein